MTRNPIIVFDSSWTRSESRFIRDGRLSESGDDRVIVIFVRSWQMSPRGRGIEYCYGMPR